MNPTTSTTFVAYRDPRYVQGKALLKAKQYDTAIDAFCELLERTLNPINSARIAMPICKYLDLFSSR